MKEKGRGRKEERTKTDEDGQWTDDERMSGGCGRESEWRVDCISGLWRKFSKQANKAYRLEINASEHTQTYTSTQKTA